MHELLADGDVIDESLPKFMDRVGGDFSSKAKLVKTLWGVSRL